MRLRSVLLSAVLLSACTSRKPSARMETAAEKPAATVSSSAIDTASPPKPDATTTSDEYGTAHLFVLQHHAPDGRWFVGCQAREDTDGDGQISASFGDHGEHFGDALRPYLFLKPGPGLPIDDFLASTPSGRYLAVVRDGALRLIDTHGGTEQVLVSGVTSDASSPRPPIRAMFSEDDTRLLYLRPEGATSTAVVRDLARGSEEVLDAGGGLLWQARLDVTGQWVEMDVVAQDTTGDGKLTWPRRSTNLGASRCRGSVTSSSSYGWTGDASVRRYRRVKGGPLFEGDDILHPMGEGLLRRAPDRSIVFEHPDGRRDTWVPAACKGDVQYADAERQQLLVACTGKNGDPPLELHGARGHQSLGWKLRRWNMVETTPPGRESHVFLDAFSTTPEESVSVIVDLEQRTVQRQEVRGTVMAQQGPHALLAQTRLPIDLRVPSKQSLWLWNLETGQKVFVGESGEYVEQRAGDLMHYRGWLVDLRSFRVLGVVEKVPLTIDSNGRALRSSRSAPAYDGETDGPVRWEPAVKAQAPRP